MQSPRSPLPGTGHHFDEIDYFPKLEELRRAIPWTIYPRHFTTEASRACARNALVRSQEHGVSEGSGHVRAHEDLEWQAPFGPGGVDKKPPPLFPTT